MSTTTVKSSRPKADQRKRRDSSDWNRRINTVPLVERGAFQLPQAADYLSLSITTVRRLIKRGLIQLLLAIRHIVIERAECVRFLHEKGEIGNFAAYCLPSPTRG